MQSEEVGFEEIARRLGGRPVRRWRLTGGVSADVQALELDCAGERRVVVVRQHRPATWRSLERGVATTEHDLMRTLADAGFAVPRPLLLDVSGAVLPLPLLVLPFVEGSSDPGDLDGALGAMAGFLVRLHQTAPDSLELPPLPARVDPVPELRDWLPPSLAHLGPGLVDTPLTGPRSVLHGDFWPANILWRDGRITAVVDWEDAAVGDPLSDLATARLELRWKHGVAASERFTERYTALAGPADSHRLALWDLYVASAALQFMGGWNLEPEREAACRRGALEFAVEAAERLSPSG